MEKLNEKEVMICELILNLIELEEEDYIEVKEYLYKRAEGSSNLEMFADALFEVTDSKRSKRKTKTA